jgi:hypothetical protein
MKVKQLRPIIRRWNERAIRRISRSDSVEEILHYIRPGEVEEIVEKYGGTVDDGISTNGWQWDYSIDVTFDGRDYVLTGDAYYQDSCMIKLKE